MVRQIVFTEHEWNEFKRRLSDTACREVHRTCTVVSKVDNTPIDSDGRQAYWWRGMFEMWFDEVIGELCGPPK